MGRRAATGPIAAIVDVVCVISVAAGTIGPVGFLGLQVSYGLNSLFGIPDVYPVQLLVIATLTAVAGVSVFSGVNRGIRFLSSANVWLALGLMAAVLVLGSAWFVVKSFFDGFALYVTDFFSMTLYRGDTEWLSGWTVFFFGWFLGYAPLMAIFVARISKGRTVRDLLISTTVLPPVATTFWFTVLGGTGIFLEQKSDGAISGPLMEGGLPAAVMAISGHLPLSLVISLGFLVLTMTFVATTTDSMSFAMSQSCMTSGNPLRGCAPPGLCSSASQRPCSSASATGSGGSAVGDRHHRCAGGLRDAAGAGRRSCLRPADGARTEGVRTVGSAAAGRQPCVCSPCSSIHVQPGGIGAQAATSRPAFELSARTMTAPDRSAMSSFVRASSRLGSPSP